MNVFLTLGIRPSWYKMVFDLVFLLKKVVDSNLMSNILFLKALSGQTESIKFKTNNIKYYIIKFKLAIFLKVGENYGLCFKFNEW